MRTDDTTSPKTGLDTVLTMIDGDAFTIYPELRRALSPTSFGRARSNNVLAIAPVVVAYERNVETRESRS